MSIQSQLAEKFLAVFGNSIVKKIDHDHYLDIHVPEINEKKGTHIFFNTSNDKIKVGFYCRDEEFVEGILVDNENSIERYSQGVRIKQNPEFDLVDDAIKAAFHFVDMITKGRTRTGTIPKNV